MSDSVRPHRQQPTRLPHPWDSLGKNTGAGCHFLLQCMKVKRESEVAQLCPTLSDPIDGSPPSSSVHGIFQARVLEWGAIAFSEGSPRAEFKSKKSRVSLYPQSRTGISSTFLCQQQASLEFFLLDEGKVQTQPPYLCLQLRSPALKQDLLRSLLCHPQ